MDIFPLVCTELQLKYLSKNVHTKTLEIHSRKYTNFYYKKANCYKTF